ncbi:MAG TPA: type II toxin-antitoxin system antitoxin SocA domain-containing protein [Patescibacteria group bacterium]|nr:type II toxin-antitoxin system antitoxin SocA domain-containing protein [Patescibacteria group bacterium]
MNAIQISERIITLARGDEKIAPELSPLKIQKLLFYTQAWYAANKDDRLFEDDIYAWPLGPVVEDVYHHYKSYGAQDLAKEESLTITCNDDSFDEDIKSVLAVYGGMSAYELVARTHKEEVWRKYKGASNKLIPFEEIRSDFKLRLNAA